MRRLIRRLPKRLSPARVVLLLAVCAAAMTFLGIHQFCSTHGTHSTLVLSEGAGATASRSVQSTTRGRQLMARPPTQLHTFLVLDAGESGASTLKALEPHLAPYRQYPEAIGITLVTGATATALAAQFAVLETSMPAVVYLPPIWQTGITRQAESFSLGKAGASLDEFGNWAKSVARMTLLLSNDWEGNEVCFNFVASDDQKEVQLGCTRAQDELWQEVSLLDVFTARNKTGGALLAQHVALFSGIFAIHPPGFCNYLANRSCEAEKLPHPTDEALLHHRTVNEERRAALLKEQPQKTKKWTTVGFQKTKAPEELSIMLNGYLNASWENLEREVWLPDDTFTNHDDAPSMKISLPRMGTLKARMTAIVQAMLEKWIGDIPLEPTATYGIRIYSTNSTLAMHCDRPDTHLVSAIINVNQDVDEPWPLQILDHAGKIHSVTMEPGDLVMYEGASCGHGRVEPLKGRYFANVFVHYRPRK